MDILTQIVAHKQEEVAQRKRLLPLEQLKQRIASAEPRPTRSMKAALASSPTAIIAEFKRRSPSKGWLHPDADVASVVPAYERAGASACSILTDECFFGGKDEDLRRARLLVDLPLLRKDFVIDAYQLYEAKLLGADAVLLIAAVLSPETCHRFAQLAHQLGLEVLLEIHSEEELRCLCPEVDMLGVNNRNLGTFHTSVANSFQLVGRIRRFLSEHPDKHTQPLLVSESGISRPEQLRVLRGQGFGGFLIGETFMKTGEPGETLRQFIQDATFIYKVCGMKDSENIREVLAAGANAIGLIYYPPSPRCVCIEDDKLVEAVHQAECRKFGVFVNERAERILTLAAHFSLTHIQLHGDESAAQCSQLRTQSGLKIVKAFGIASAEDLKPLEDYVESVDYFLFDTRCSSRGGSGRSFDWDILADYRLPVPFLLSGGLSLQNKEQLRNFAHPYWAGIDLNSGVECSPGVKDPALVQQIISCITNH